MSNPSFLDLIVKKINTLFGSLGASTSAQKEDTSHANPIGIATQYLLSKQAVTKIDKQISDAYEQLKVVQQTGAFEKSTGIIEPLLQELRAFLEHSVSPKSLEENSAYYNLCTMNLRRIIDEVLLDIPCNKAQATELIDVYFRISKLSLPITFNQLFQAVKSSETQVNLPLGQHFVQKHIETKLEQGSQTPKEWLSLLENMSLMAGSFLHNSGRSEVVQKRSEHWWEMLHQIPLPREPLSEDIQLWGTQKLLKSGEHHLETYQWLEKKIKDSPPASWYDLTMIALESVTVARARPQSSQMPIAQWLMQSAISFQQKHQLQQTMQDHAPPSISVQRRL